MDQNRIFGKELTNLVDDPLRHKRNYSFLQAQRHRDNSVYLNKPLNLRPSSKSQTTQPEVKTLAPELKIQLNEQMVSAYFLDNIQFLKRKEKETYKLTDYVLDHDTVTQNSRAKLIDWLCQLQFKFKMFQETIFTVVTLIDRYLMKKSVQIRKLQLVGVSALYIAAKFQETYQVPQLKQLVSCCANQYTANQILQMEANIIHQLNFELIVNSSYKFFEPLSKVIGLEPKNFHLAQYLLELSMLKSRFLVYSPSLIASSAIYLIKKIRKSESSWNELMTTLVGYKQNELKTCAKDLCCLLENSNSLENCESIKKKFSMASFHEVTKIKLERRDKK